MELSAGDRHRQDLPPAGGAVDYCPAACDGAPVAGQPDVWRNAHPQAAVKVGALSGNGMAEIEVPAFLREQAD